MQLKVRMTFNEEQRQIITRFAMEVGMSVPEFCKRAVFYAINKSYEEASTHQHALEKEEENGIHNTESGVTDGDIQPGVLEAGPTNSSPLAYTEDGVS